MAFYAFHRLSAWLWSAAQIGRAEVGPGRTKVKRPPTEEKNRVDEPASHPTCPAGRGLSCRSWDAPRRSRSARFRRSWWIRSTVTIFRPGTTPDLANELYSVRLVSAEADCVYNNSTSIVRASMDLTFKATRAPSSEGATYTVPYFVAVA